MDTNRNLIKFENFQFLPYSSFDIVNVLDSFPLANHADFNVLYLTQLINKYKTAHIKELSIDGKRELSPLMYR